MLRILILPLLLLSNLTFAQTDSAATESALPDSSEKLKALVIPFEEKLFYCDIMRDLTAANGLTKQEVFHRFRNGIQLSLKTALSDTMQTATFLATDSINNEDLVLIYQQLGYNYTPIPVRAEEGKTKKEKGQPEQKQEAGIRGGQVIAERDNTPRYMNATLQDASVLKKLHDTYGINRFLFINQLDVKMDLTDPEMAFIDPKRLVGAHYTILDANGAQIIGGYASQAFAGTESNIDRIMAETLPSVASAILHELKVKKKEAETQKKPRSKTK